MLGLIRYITSPFPSIDTLVSLYCALVLSKLEFSSVARNSVTLTDSSKIEGVQRKFANLCYNIFFINFSTNKCDEISDRRNLSMLLNSLFLINVFVKKSLVLPSLIPSVYGHSQKQSETTLSLPFHMVLRPVFLPDMLMRLMLSVVKSIFSITMVSL
jgi:hypothetical protein